MVDRKPKLIPATARLTAERKPTKTQRLRLRRQITAWRGKSEEQQERKLK